MSSKYVFTPKRGSPICEEEENSEVLKRCYLTIRPVALEGEGSNCFSITQLVGQKRQ